MLLRCAVSEDKSQVYTKGFTGKRSEPISVAVHSDCQSSFRASNPTNAVGVKRGCGRSYASVQFADFRSVMVCLIALEGSHFMHFTHFKPGPNCPFSLVDLIRFFRFFRLKFNTWIFHQNFRRSHHIDFKPRPHCAFFPSASDGTHHGVIRVTPTLATRGKYRVFFVVCYIHHLRTSPFAYDKFSQSRSCDIWLLW